MIQYSFSASIDQPIDSAIETLKQTLMSEHLGIVSDVAVSEIVKNKLGEDMPPYRILGACNPKMAKTMIEADAAIGALLPCTIVARENDGSTTFDFMDPEMVLAMAGDEIIKAVAAEAKQKLLLVSEKLSA